MLKTPPPPTFTPPSRPPPQSSLSPNLPPPIVDILPHPPPTGTCSNTGAPSTSKSPSPLPGGAAAGACPFPSLPHSARLLLTLPPSFPFLPPNRTCRLRRKVRLLIARRRAPTWTLLTHRPAFPARPLGVPYFQKCDEQREEGDACRTCRRLQLDCLGWGPRRPDWMRVRHLPPPNRAAARHAMMMT